MKKQSREYELKLALNSSPSEFLQKSHSLLSAKSGKTEEVRSVYFDTKTERLRRAGMSLRVRAIGDKRVQTVKANGSRLHRGQWEAQVPALTPDAEAAAATPLKKLTAKRGFQRTLAPIFETQVKRRTWDVQRDNSRIEVALDEGLVVAGDRRSNVLEVELELKQGTPSALFNLASELLAIAPLRPALITKSQRGYLLREAALEHPVRDLELALHREMTTADAARSIVHSCLSQVLHNEQLLRDSRHHDALHQTRVGFRRLRAALTFLAPLLKKDMEDVAPELRRLARLLGEARDLDVFIERMTPSLPMPIRDAPGFQALCSDFQMRREQAYDAIINALKSSEFSQLLLNLIQKTETSGWLKSKDPKIAKLRREPIGPYAREILERRLQRLLKAARNIEKITADQRHEVRISAKKLLYMAEFVRSLAHSRSYVTTAKALKVIQSRLGDANDARITQEKMIELAQNCGESKTQTLFAAGAIYGVRTSEQINWVPEVTKALQKLSRRKVFWRDFA